MWDAPRAFWKVGWRVVLRVGTMADRWDASSADERVVRLAMLESWKAVVWVDSSAAPWEVSWVGSWVVRTVP